jgi:hypothetical protein
MLGAERTSLLGKLKRDALPGRLYEHISKMLGAERTSPRVLKRDALPGRLNNFHQYASLK